MRECPQRRGSPTTKAGRPHHSRGWSMVETASCPPSWAHFPASFAAPWGCVSKLSSVQVSRSQTPVSLKKKFLPGISVFLPSHWLEALEVSC